VEARKSLWREAIVSLAFVEMRPYENLMLLVGEAVNGPGTVLLAAKLKPTTANAVEVGGVRYLKTWNNY
jgi:hypothetical protein